MDSKQLYLAWVRTNHPQIYMQALRSVANQPRSTGGLQNDLLLATIAPGANTFLGDDVSAFDSGTTTDFSAVSDSFGTPQDFPSLNFSSSPALQDISVDTSGVSINPAVAAAISQSASSGTDVFSSVADAVAKIATTALNTSAQSNLLSVNTQRARQGLPPLTANGVPVTAGMLSPTSASVAAMERALAGAMKPGTLLMIGGAVLAGFLLLGRKSRR